ncbi:inositol monophosphatase [bacterium NHP-B]|nr:inositol monophosphatase [bacterium NHP-B]
MSYRTFYTPCPFVNIMARTAFSAAKGLLRDFGEVENLQVSAKSTKDFVSVADRRSEKTIFKELKKAYPDFGFIMEEQGVVEGEKPMTFVIDPLDGTLNFLNGLPHFAISIGLLLNDTPLAGVILDPVRDELFWASKGVGAFVNKRRLRASTTTKQRTHLISASHISLPTAQKNYLETFANFRLSGSTALDLAYVAAGRLDGFLAYNLPLWDQAAAAIIIEEARGRIHTHPSQLRQGSYTVACSPSLDEKLMKMIVEVDTHGGN